MTSMKHDTATMCRLSEEEARAMLERVRWMLVPIAAYLVITLLLPAANGATNRAAFGRHAAFVLLACIAVMSAVAIGGAISNALRRKR